MEIQNRIHLGVMFAIATFIGAPSGLAESIGSFGTDSWLERSLRGRIFFLRPGTQRLPDLRRFVPAGTIYTRQLDVPTRVWQQGFPGVTNRFEWFAIEYDGLINVQSAGYYGLRLVSDDGSKLYIDGELIIDNDGVHPTRSAQGNASLASGQHKIRIQYFQGPRFYVALQLFCTPAGGSERLFPNCGMRLETPIKTATDSKVLGYSITDSRIRSYGDCSGKDSCGPEGDVHYHVVLNAGRTVRVQNPTNRAVTIRNKTGSICWTSAGKYPDYFRCNTAEGNAWKEGGDTFLAPRQKAGALIYWTQDGYTYFSVNGLKENIVEDRGGQMKFKDQEGSFEFDVEVPPALSGASAQQRRRPALPTSPCANDRQWHKFGDPQCVK